jgi:hypothetical protein
MTPDQGSTSPEREYRAVIVGLRQGSGYIERVWVQNDGGLSDGGRVHYPLPGRSALGDAALVFGLSDPREFSISDLTQADAYAAELRRDLGGR